MPTLITKLSELKEHASSSRLTVVDAFGSFCGPCKAIAPFVDQLSRKYSTTQFLMFDVEEAPELSQSLGIRAMPTFIFFKSGKEIDRMQGADQQTLEEKVKQHGVAYFEGAGRRLGDVQGAAAAIATPTPTATTTATNNHSQQQQQQPSSEAINNSNTSSSWPLEVPPNETAGKIMLQMPDGVRNPLKVAPKTHRICDVFKAVSIMLEKPITSFALAVREGGTKPVDLSHDDTRTLTESKVAGGVVILRFKS